MMRIISFFVKTLYISMLFFILLAGVAIFLTTTTPGLNTLINFSPLYLPGTLKIKHLQGSLLHDFAITGLKYQDKETQITVKKLIIQWHPSSLKNHLLTAHWNNLKGNIGGNRHIESPQGTLKAIATFPLLILNLDSKISMEPEEHWQMKATLDGTFPWQWAVQGELSPTGTLLKKQAGLHTHLSVKGIIKNKNHGNLVVTIAPGSYQIPENNSIPPLQFTGGTINLTLTPKQLAGKGLIAIDKNKQLKISFQLPEFTLDTGLNATQPINSKLTLEINSLDFLQNMTPEIEQIKGQLIASLQIKGRWGHPRINSQILLHKSSFFVPKLGLDLDAGEVTVHVKENVWDAKGAIKSTGHPLSLTGSGNLKPELTGEISLIGNDIPIMKTSEYQINSTPQLKLHFTSQTHSIAGSILIPSAKIKPQAFTNSLSLPEEVIYKKQKEPASSPIINSNMDISITMGSNVEIDFKGLKGHLDGTLNIKQKAQNPISAYGELSVRDGTYKAYGQELTIKKGQLIFTGGAVNNPGISLRAAKTINNTSANYASSSQLFNFNSSNLQTMSWGDEITLGVEVSGRLTHPKIQLFSEPAIFSQADILSMLVLGRPANQANKAGGQLLLAAISSMNVGGTNSTQLLEQLKQSSGLDLNVQTNTNYNQITNTATDSTAVVVGKSLSKRLYLSYNIGLSQTDTNMLTLKYILNKFFSIQISNSTSSSAIDILYTGRKNKLKDSPPLSKKIRENLQKTSNQD